MSIESYLNDLCPAKNDRPEVLELVLDQIKTQELNPKDKRLLEEFSGLFFFSMNDCGLRGLNNLPELKELEVLELNDNRIKGSELKKLVVYKNLSKLSLSNNLVTSIDEIKVLNSLENLAILDLIDNPITKIQNYREEVFKALPKLLVLDMTYKSGEAYYSDDSEEDEDLEDEEEENEEDFIEEENNEDDGEMLDEEDDDESEEGPKKKRRLD